jgi:membrane protease YdiL (CAAX protease family)
VATETDARPNGIARLTERARTGALTWAWPLVMCGIRLPILLGCFLVSLLIAHAAGQANPAGFAEGLTRFDLPIVADVICLALLWRLMRREGARLRDLFCWSRQHLIRDLVMGVGLFMMCYLVLGGIIAAIAIAAVSGSAAQQGQAMQSLLAGAAINPLGMGWQIGMSALIVPISGGITEELVYRGYALPRLTALTGKPWLAIGLTTLGFTAQHLAYGLTSWQTALSGMAGVAVAGLLFGVIYFLTRQRLTALVFIHWQFDVISLGIAPILLAMFIK